MIASPAVCVVDVPVDAGAVRRRVIGERRRAAVALNSVLYERRQVGAFRHAFRVGRTTDEVVTVVAVVLRQLDAALSHTRPRYQCAELCFFYVAQKSEGFSCTISMFFSTSETLVLATCVTTM